MFSSGQGFWWSPSGKYLAYIESNDTQVHNIEYSWFGDDQYPSTVYIPYPKVGPSRHSLCNFNMPVCSLLLLFYARALCSLCLILAILFSVSVQPGTPNPVVKVFVVDTDNTTDITQIMVPTLFQNR